LNKNIVIKAENISKQYRLGQVGTGTISHDLNRFWHKIRGKEDPYLKIGETNDRTTKGDSDYVWSLQDINFEIEQAVQSAPAAGQKTKPVKEEPGMFEQVLTSRAGRTFTNTLMREGAKAILGMFGLGGRRR
jgi:hypothetical protein